MAFVGSGRRLDGRPALGGPPVPVVPSIGIRGPPPAAPGDSPMTERTEVLSPCLCISPGQGRPYVTHRTRRCLCVAPSFKEWAAAPEVM